MARDEPAHDQLRRTLGSEPTVYRSTGPAEYFRAGPAIHRVSERSAGRVVPGRQGCGAGHRGDTVDGIHAADRVRLEPGRQGNIRNSRQLRNILRHDVERGTYVEPGGGECGALDDTGWVRRTGDILRESVWRSAQARAEHVPSPGDCGGAV